MQHRRWLLKSEPHTWSWHQQQHVEFEPWNGVRNYQASRYLSEMHDGDCAFFYHSGKERSIVGIVQIVGTPYKDLEDERFFCVDVKAISEVGPISLTCIKNAIPGFMKQSRLSVMPILEEEWNLILSLGVKRDIL